MFKSIYTTRMSDNAKVLCKRFEKINSKPMKLGRMAVALCTVFLIAVFACSTLVMAKIAGDSEEYTLDITNNGEIIEFENKPFIEGGEVYLPLREFFTKIGMMETENAKMDWNNGTVLISLCEKNLNEDVQFSHTSYAYKIEIGKSELVINPIELLPGYTPEEAASVAEPMNNAPILKNNITYIPFAYAERIVYRTAMGLFSPPDRYNLEILYSGEILSIEYPVAGYYEITEAFGKRVHPITGEEQFHTGIDFEVPEGTDVKAGISGKVIDSGFDVEKGNYVVLQNESGVEILYSQLSQITRRDVYNVEKDDVVGKSGNTGMSTGPHLHMEVKINGEYVDPELYLEKSVYDELLAAIAVDIPRMLERSGHPDADYKIIDIDYASSMALIKVQIFNYDNKILSIIYNYVEDTPYGWTGSVAPEAWNDVNFDSFVSG